MSKGSREGIPLRLPLHDKGQQSWDWDVSLQERQPRERQLDRATQHQTLQGAYQS